LTIVTSDTEVPSDAPITISGTLTDATGTPVSSREIALVEHLVGEPGWSKVPGDEATTGADGQVSFTVPGLNHTARFALHAGGHVHSNVIRVAVDPTITAVVATPAVDASETTVTVTVVGAEPGDLVILAREGRHRMTRTAGLSTTGEATFTVPVPQRHDVAYRVVVHHTDAHTAKVVVIRVSPPEQPTS
jgi:hypothetical protein